MVRWFARVAPAAGLVVGAAPCRPSAPAAARVANASVGTALCSPGRASTPAALDGAGARKR